MKIVILLALVLTLNACSFSDSNKEQVSVHQDDLEFAVDTIADQANEDINVEEQKIASVDAYMPDEPKPNIEEITMTAPEEPLFGDFQKYDDKDESLIAEQETKEVSPKSNEIKNDSAIAKVDTREAPAKIYIEEAMTASQSIGPIEKYRVQKGDTLMMIAFKIYGDYRKWKDIKELNKDVRKIVEGTDLRYYVPNQKFGWLPSGKPYMIKTGDTLSIIAIDKYGSSKKWKSIYDNNRPLIKNPNLIFAGFTIYYKPARELASEPK